MLMTSPRTLSRDPSYAGRSPAYLTCTCTRRLRLRRLATLRQIGFTRRGGKQKSDRLLRALGASPRLWPYHQEPEMSSRHHPNSDMSIARKAHGAMYLVSPDHCPLCGRRGKRSLGFKTEGYVTDDDARENNPTNSEHVWDAKEFTLAYTCGECQGSWIDVFKLIDVQVTKEPRLSVMIARSARNPELVRRIPHKKKIRYGSVRPRRGTRLYGRSK